MNRRAIEGRWQEKCANRQAQGNEQRSELGLQNGGASSLGFGFGFGARFCGLFRCLWPVPVSVSVSVSAQITGTGTDHRNRNRDRHGLQARITGTDYRHGSQRQEPARITETETGTETEKTFPCRPNKKPKGPAAIATRPFRLRLRVSSLSRLRRSRLGTAASCLHARTQRDSHHVERSPNEDQHDDAEDAG